MNNQLNPCTPSINDTRIEIITRNNGTKEFHSEICSQVTPYVYWQRLNTTPHSDMKEAQAYLDRHHGNKIKSVEYIKYP